MLENFTAQQLLSGDFGGDYKVLLINLLAFTAGLLAHVLQKMSAEKISFSQYWMKEGLNSFASVVGLFATFVSMVTMAPGAPLYAFFSMAYMGDSLLNKAPKAVVEPEVGTRGFKEDALEVVDGFKEDALEVVDGFKVVAEKQVEKHGVVRVVGAAVLFVLLVIVVL
jgi:hypothetical protein